MLFIVRLQQKHENFISSCWHEYPKILDMLPDWVPPDKAQIGRKDEMGEDESCPSFAGWWNIVSKFIWRAEEASFVRLSSCDEFMTNWPSRLDKYFHSATDLTSEKGLCGLHSKRRGRTVTAPRSGQLWLMIQTTLCCVEANRWSETNKRQLFIVSLKEFCRCCFNNHYCRSHYELGILWSDFITRRKQPRTTNVRAVIPVLIEWKIIQRFLHVAAHYIFIAVRVWTANRILLLLL